MVAFRLEAFGGAIPLRGRRLLPDQFAADCANVDLISGELRGLPTFSRIMTFETVDESGNWLEGAFAKIYRLPDGTYVPLASRFGKISAYPLVNDKFDRYVIHDNNTPANPQALMLSTAARLAEVIPPQMPPGEVSSWGAEAFLLGVPAPTATPTYSVPNPTDDIEKSVVYTYTYVDSYGQEGPPGPATTVVMDADATVTIENIPNPMEDTAVIPPSGPQYAFFFPESVENPPEEASNPKVRIYRTVTSAAGIATYYRVADITVTAGVPGPLSYSDDHAAAGSDDALIASGSTLQSASWAPPPTACGFIAMPNGFFAAWKGKEIYFSEPYRPWAWPPEYMISVDFDVVGCGVLNQTLVVVTEGNPYLIGGTRPNVMSMSKIDSIESGVSAPSIVSSPEGVYFATKRGLMRVGSGGMENITRDLISEDEWVKKYGSNIIAAVRHETRYTALVDVPGGDSATGGFLLDWRDARTAFARLQSPTPITNMWTDPWTGEVHSTRQYTATKNGGAVGFTDLYSFNNPSGSRAVYMWKSKEFAFPKPMNLGAFVINFDDYVVTPTGSWGPLGQETVLLPSEPDENEGVPDLPSGVVHEFILNDYRLLVNGFGRTTQTPRDYARTLYLPPEYIAFAYIYANRRLVWQGPIRSWEVIRLPSGFKTSVWQVQVVAKVPIYSIHVASTAKELSRV